MKILALTVFVLAMAVVPVSAQQRSFGEGALKQREDQCGMDYQRMRSTDPQLQALCIQAFSLQCMKKQALSPSYRKQYPQVTDEQLRQGIRDIDNNLQLVCAGMPQNLRERCAHCP